MRKALCLLLALLLLLAVCGCKNNDNICFFYPRSEIHYDIPDGVIAPEIRDLRRSDFDLSYLLKLYLEGPVSQELYSPFPAGTALESLSYAGGQLFIALSEPFAALENLDYTIACVCIASTCFALTDADAVTVKTQHTSITLTPDQLVLEDTAAASSPE